MRAAVGDQNLEVSVESVDKWNAVAQTAEVFQQGRIFIAGDAAHTMPPTGGFGGNTGIQDAHNLAWKLALVVQGVAGPELIDTYNAERQPAGYQAVGQNCELVLVEDVCAGLVVRDSKGMAMGGSA